MSERQKFHHVEDDADGKPEEYAVGYRKPPKHARFPPGRSGNPRGRPRARPRLAYEQHDIPFRLYMMEMTTVTINGKKTRVTRFDALLYVAYQNAMKGDFRFIKLLIEQTGGFKEFRADYIRQANSEDQKVIEAVLAAGEALLKKTEDK